MTRRRSTSIFTTIAIIGVAVLAFSLFLSRRGTTVPELGKVDSPPTVPPVGGKVETAPPVKAPASLLNRKDQEVKLKLLVPAYFFPAGPPLEDWNRLFRAADKVPTTVIVNPGSGPGTAVDASYSETIVRAKTAHITIVGYVNTEYAKRPQADVQSDIERWIRFYPQIDGIFLDAQASGAESLDYYVALSAFIKKKITRGVVISNPGSMCAEAYFSRPATDTACVFEFPEKFDQFYLPPWGSLYPAGCFAAMPYGVEDEGKMREFLSQTIRRNIGYVYITDAKGKNPWGRLPFYWEAEVAAIHRINQRQTP